ncbi:zinc-ribbon domain-containing protein [Leptotrichia wadei]|uniref:zinc-ribbon domain-containing protein n=1 Tax=Leptotrichia wadei TaxID=157687 RepID=UPI0026F007CD|nr:zinc-ribbon domain-containing protein [Leptotrichia wadei]
MLEPCDFSHGRFREYRDWFTLFWIPVFPISGRKEYLECPICRQVYDVPKD